MLQWCKYHHPYFRIVESRLSFPFFIAQRLFRSKESGGQRASNPAILIATLGVAIGLAVMLLAVGIVRGFQREITDKVVGFGAHIEVLDLRSLFSPEVFPIEADSGFCAELQGLDGVRHVQRAAQKMGVLKTAENFQGITLKGLSADYDTSFLSRCLLEGTLPQADSADLNGIVISRRQADDLELRVGDRVYAYFFEKTVKTRRFNVLGIYETHMSQFDDVYVFTDFPTVCSLNGWKDNECSVVELHVDNLDRVDDVRCGVALQVAGRRTSNDTPYSAITIREHYPQIFSWLSLLDMNVWVILCLMAAVAAFTMVSGLLILILERINMIGVLKALGASNMKIRGIFLYLATLIVVRGVLLGDALALLLIFIQKRWGLVRLDAEAYHLDVVPIDLTAWIFVVVNLATVLITVLALIVPSYMISRVKPVKAIKFD